jgi:hypothetical protein
MKILPWVFGLLHADVLLDVAETYIVENVMKRKSADR